MTGDGLAGRKAGCAATLALLDLSDLDPARLNAGRAAGLADRLAATADAVLVLDVAARSWPLPLPVAVDRPSVVAAARSIGADCILYAEGGQIFLDPAVVRHGLTAFRASGRDFLTQWEHCRLPVGIGVRAARAVVVEAAAGDDPRPVFDTTAIAGNRVFHDDHAHVGHDDSLLDARSSPALDAVLAARSGEPDWSLAGFLDLAREDGAPRYVAPADRPGLRRDERGMPAAYGFESAACADFPTYVMFDLTNRCNALCVHCPQSVGFAGQETPGFLAFEDYAQVIDECVGRPLEFVRLTADGEPLLHPRVYDMIAYATARGVGPVGLTTNGSALNQRNAARLLDAGLDVIDVSLDAFSAGTFAAVRVGLSYERTVGNLRRLIALRDRRGSPLRIMVSFVAQPLNAHERDAFKAYWTPLVDKVLIRELHSNVGLNPSGGGAGEVERWPCPHWFRRTVVTHTGEIKACPIDWNNESVYRPVRETTIRDAWHSDFYRRNRQEHLNDAISPCSLCHGCSDWRGTPWDLGYEKVIRTLRAPDAA